MSPRYSLPLLAALLAFALPVQAAIVINEVDYDQPGTDTAEFIELKNTGPVAVNLQNYKVELVNGNLGGAAVYQTITLPSFSLAVGAYYVISGNSSLVPFTNLVVTPATNLIQNGPPDAIGLRDPISILRDAVSYEGNTGAPYTETSGTLLVDDGSNVYASLSRFPDGADTDNNNLDFSLRCASPGSPNVATSGTCGNPVPTHSATWGQIKTIYR